MTRNTKDTKSYVYIWDYTVVPERVEDFQRVYGPDGEWVRLFRQAPGYVRTELHRDVRQPNRFLTIDYWESRSAWETFRAQFATRFEELDARCAELTARETEIGRFEPVARVR
jgi:quinol monooxygenase YgiN